LSFPSSSAIATLTLTIPAGTPIGTYHFTVTGTNGSLSHTISLTFQVVSVPDFDLSTPNANLTGTISPGAVVTFPVSVSPVNGFTGTVTLAAAGLPVGASASFSPASIAGGTGSSTMTITTTASTPLGTFPLTLTAASGALSHAETVNLAMNSSAAFTINVQGQTQVLGTGSYSVYAYGSNGFTGLVQFSASGLPSGITASFSPTSANIDPTLGYTSSALTLTIPNSVSNGTYSFTTTVTSGTLAQSQTFTFTVFAFLFSQTNAIGCTDIISPGTTHSYPFQVSARSNFTGSIALGTAPPSGWTATVSPASVGGAGTFTLTIIVPSTATVIPAGKSTSSSSEQALGPSPMALPPPPTHRYNIGLTGVSGANSYAQTMVIQTVRCLGLVCYVPCP
jgi:uncharacterized membrane protein